MTKDQQKPEDGSPLSKEDAEKSRAAFNKWYAANKAKHNQSRKEAYASNPERKAKAAEYQREYRKANPRPASDGSHYRKVGKKSVQVFRITEAAQMIGRSAQGLRLWEANGLIPKPSIKGLHRYYTMNQVTLMSELGDVMSQVRYTPAVKDTAISAKVDEIKKKWTVL